MATRRPRQDGQGTTTKTNAQQTHAILKAMKKDSARYFKKWCDEYSAKVRNLAWKLTDGRTFKTKADAQGPNHTILVWRDDDHVIQLYRSEIKVAPPGTAAYFAKE